MYDLLNAYLENGLRVILHKIPNVSTVSCGLWIRQGSCYETDSNNGLSHLAEHLLLNPDDTENAVYKDILNQIISEGVYYNALTTKEYTCYHFTGLKRSLQYCLQALFHIGVNNRAINAEAFDKEKQVVIQEAKGFYSSFQQIKERTSQALWGNTGVGKIIMGDLAVVGSATIEQVSELIDSAYVPDNSLLVVVGDIDYEEEKKKIEDIFGKWQFDTSDLPQEIVNEEPSLFINNSNSQRSVFSIGFRAPAYSESNRSAAEMMMRIIGQSGMHSRMIKELRIKHGLSYNLGSFGSFYKKRGTIGFTVTCDNERTIEAAKLLIEVLQNAKENGLTEEEIEREKKMMETALILSVDSINEHLRHVGMSAMIGQDFYIENELKNIRRITKAKIDKVTDMLLQNESMGVAAIGCFDVDKLLAATTM
ncbi:Predicted Zn-dependent peptidase [Butyrivibrio fibrisolvens]|uniref:Predicted Zn-dependent peptidase n=1 Tax=Butyrivibrio fibrisolvens TaxID=831 RepID=A0A1H9KCB0_BUTFI|nr:Predicted Zn-dependent peptidase [Butyrivibrio fibrisolvens]